MFVAVRGKYCKDAEATSMLATDSHEDFGEGVGSIAATFKVNVPYNSGSMSVNGLTTKKDPIEFGYRKAY